MSNDSTRDKDCRSGSLWVTAGDTAIPGMISLSQGQRPSTLKCTGSISQRIYRARQKLIRNRIIAGQQHCSSKQEETRIEYVCIQHCCADIQWVKDEVKIASRWIDRYDRLSRNKFVRFVVFSVDIIEERSLGHPIACTSSQSGWERNQLTDKISKFQKSQCLSIWSRY